MLEPPSITRPVRSAKEENALRMLLKSPGSGEQVASVRLPCGDESADRCPQARGPRGPSASWRSAWARPPGARRPVLREAARPVSLRAARGARCPRCGAGARP